MLASAARLRRRSDFAATVRGGRRAGSGALMVHLALPPVTEDVPPPANGTGGRPAPARAGFVVPRTVGGAVARNRVRRRLRHLMRDRLSVLPSGTDVVVRALPGAQHRDFAGLAADLDRAMTGALAARTSRAARPRRARRRTRSS